MGCLEGNGVPVLYMGRTVPKSCASEKMRMYLKIKIKLYHTLNAIKTYCLS
jgi:hypothetical protein